MAPLFLLVLAAAVAPLATASTLRHGLVDNSTLAPGESPRGGRKLLATALVQRPAVCGIGYEWDGVCESCCCRHYSAKVCTAWSFGGDGDAPLTCVCIALSQCARRMPYAACSRTAVQQLAAVHVQQRLPDGHRGGVVRQSQLHWQRVHVHHAWHVHHRHACHRSSVVLCRQLRLWHPRG